MGYWLQQVLSLQSIFHGKERAESAGINVKYSFADFSGNPTSASSFIKAG